MAKTRIQAAVVGLGQIGSGYDALGRAGPPRSHVGAILADPAFELAAVCDTDSAARAEFKRAWPAPAKVYDSLDAMLAAAPYDLIVVAVPTAAHEQALRLCLGAKPKAVFCEKPMGSSTTTAVAIANSYEEAGIPLAVNYHRRWDERFATLRAALPAAGKIRAAELVYVKGLRNYGAHAVDLLQSLFGAVTEVRAIAAASHGGDDPSYSASLRFVDGLVVSLVGLDGLGYELFDLEIIANRARFRVEFGGQSIRRQIPAADRHHPGYTSLSEEQFLVPDGPVHGLSGAYRELAAWITEHEPPSTSLAANAIAVHRVLDAIIASAASGKEITL